MSILFDAPLQFPGNTAYTSGYVASNAYTWHRDFEKACNEAYTSCRNVLCRHLDGAKVKDTVTVHTLC